MTIMKEAKLGRLTDEMRRVAEDERVNVEKLRSRIATGKNIILKNVAHENFRIVGIGEGLTTKINANIGTSSELCNPNYELEKAAAAVKYGADTVMDLSTSGDLDKIRNSILKAIKVPLGTVPIYQAEVETIRKNEAMVNMTEDDVFNVVEKHAGDGVDFMTIHAGITKQTVEKLKDSSRVTGIVSRGGAFLANWMVYNKKENPLYQNFDYLLEIARKYDFCISLGDALRPGCLADASDWFQIQELLTIQKLVEKCWDADVQVMVEGPGHLPLDHVEVNVILEKKLCKGAPFYVLGPLVTDAGLGYDHIVGAIGGALAALYGADFLCYVTPTEHLGLPRIEDVKEGVIAAKIAGHCADLVKLKEKTMKVDLEMSLARAKLDWETQYRISMDSEKAKKVRERVDLKTGACSMCGEYCTYRVFPVKRRGSKPSN